MPRSILAERARVLCDVFIALFFLSLLFLGPPDLLALTRGTFRWFSSLSTLSMVLLTSPPVFSCLCYFGSVVPPPPAAPTANTSAVATMMTLMVATAYTPTGPATVSPADTTTSTPAATTTNESPPPTLGCGAAGIRHHPSVATNSSRRVSDDTTAKAARIYAAIVSLKARVAALNLAFATQVSKNAELKVQLAEMRAENAIVKVKLEAERRKARMAIELSRFAFNYAKTSTVGEPTENPYVPSSPRQSTFHVVEYCDDQARLLGVKATPVATTLASEASIPPLLLPQDIPGGARPEGMPPVAGPSTLSI
ncbi:hypothetical protein GY45DRAFT_1371511 [Cubamyces sp. BRFM 1775]|nr:hypothetical protein GY45DRAFT_1371511 [Cubamyces sp. BRFM 1775]